MSNSRPKNLPNFEKPPLNEVVLAVQFEKPKRFSDAYVGKVWDLYQEQYPICEQQPARPPNFETFGADNKRSFNLGFGTAGSRYIFSSKDRQNLLQYQSDIFVKNWKTTSVDGAKYPRFETIIKEFSNEYKLLNMLYSDVFDTSVQINQAEVTYVNVIPLGAEKNMSEASEWVNFLDTKGLQLEGITTKLTQVIRNDSGSPMARLTYTCQSVMGNNNERALMFDLSFRGAPSETSFDCSKEFLEIGRNEIVEAFAKLTTAKAHEIWGRTQ